MRNPNALSEELLELADSMPSIVPTTSVDTPKAVSPGQPLLVGLLSLQRLVRGGHQRVHALSLFGRTTSGTSRRPAGEPRARQSWTCRSSDLLTRPRRLGWCRGNSIASGNHGRFTTCLRPCVPLASWHD